MKHVNEIFDFIQSGGNVHIKRVAVAKHHQQNTNAACCCDKSDLIFHNRHSPFPLFLTDVYRIGMLSTCTNAHIKSFYYSTFAPRIQPKHPKEHHRNKGYFHIFHVNPPFSSIYSAHSGVSKRKSRRKPLHGQRFPAVGILNVVLGRCSSGCTVFHGSF